MRLDGLAVTFRRRLHRTSEPDCTTAVEGAGSIRPTNYCLLGRLFIYEIVAWNILLPCTISCRVMKCIGQHIHAYLEDGSTLRCRAGSLTLVPAGCEGAAHCQAT